MPGYFRAIQDNFHFGKNYRSIKKSVCQYYFSKCCKKSCVFIVNIFPVDQCWASFLQNKTNETSHINACATFYLPPLCSDTFSFIYRKIHLTPVMSHDYGRPTAAWNEPEKHGPHGEWLGSLTARYMQEIFLTVDANSMWQKR